MVINMFTKAFLFFLLVVVAMAILFGGLLSGAEAFSPSTTAAKAHEMEVSTAYQARLNALDLQLKAAQTEQEINRINLAIAKEQADFRRGVDNAVKYDALKLAFFDDLRTVLLILIGVAGLVTIFAAAFVILRLSLDRLLASRSLKVGEDTDIDPGQMRSTQPQAADRQPQDPMRSGRPAVQSKDDRNQDNYKDLPLAM